MRKGEVINKLIKKKKEQAQGFFKKRWPRQNEETVSDFGAYCVEQWLSGRNPKTSYEYLGIDFLRQFANRLGTRGSSDIMCQPTRVVYDPEIGGSLQFGADSTELRRFNESSLLRDRRLSRIQRAVLILYFQWGLNEKEIGDCFGFTESRTCQIKAGAQATVSKTLLLEESGKRKREEQTTLPRQIQVECGMDEKAKRILDKIRKEAVETMALRKEQEIPEKNQDVGSFAICSF